MTTRTLYVPVKIASTEQARALPEGTIARHPEFRTACIKTDMTEDGETLWYDTDDGSQSATSLIGWTALVPVGVEEVAVIASGGLERDIHGAIVLNSTPDGPRRDYRRTEYHSQWEDA